mgnify:CR=1 FL=1
MALFLGSCKKYDEGPFISLRSKEKRMSGEWKVQKFLINDFDSTNCFNKYENAHFIFNLDRIGQSVIACSDFSANPKPIIVLNGKWEWINNKNKININYTSSSGAEDNPFELCPFIINNSTDWEVKRLTKNEFYLEANCDGEFFRLELKR